MTLVLSALYDAIAENRNELFRIHITHKKWGNEWYRLVETKNYDDAKLVLIGCAKGKGEDLITALNCLNTIPRLEAQITMIEKWGA